MSFETRFVIRCKDKQKYLHYKLLVFISSVFNVCLNY